jgi:tetratricopeptide (TPR) repeat protein
VDYETFEDMWAVANHSYHVIHPKNYLEVLSKKNTEKEYRGRSPNERAAFQLLHGCSLSSMSRYPEAEEQLEKGALIPDISKGYQHLLLFELARHQAARGAIDDAIESTKLAIKKLPKNYYPWEYLVVLYKSGGYAEGEQKAAEKAEKKAHKLREKSSAARVVARTIPSDYYIPGLSGLRGWGLASPKSSH